MEQHVRARIGARAVSVVIAVVALATGLVLAPAARPTGGASAAAATTCVAAPTYTPTRTLFGSSLSTGTVDFQTAFTQTTADFGTLKIVRVFDSGLPPANAWERRAPVLGSTPVITSFRPPVAEVLAGKHDAALRAFFQSAPTNMPILWTYWHEPEKEILAGKFTTTQFKAAFQRIANIAKGVCRPNLFPTLVLMGWTTNPASKRNWVDYYPGSAYVSTIAFDPYNNANGQPTSYPEPSTMFSYVVQVGKASGKPWGIAETGSGTVSTDTTGSGRAAWLLKMATYFKNNGAAFVSYYNSDRQANFKLRDTPSKDAWRKVVTTY